MTDDTSPTPPKPGATAALILADGTIFWGKGFGASTQKVGEVVFNTSMTGYQEIMTDPSYAGQIITFTFPHIGNVGANMFDLETTTPASCGMIVRADVTKPSNYRSIQHLEAWMKSHDLPGISGIDTRALTRRIRDAGAPNGVIVHAPSGAFDIPALLAEAKAWPGLKGMDLAKEVTTRQTYKWNETLWSFDEMGYGTMERPKRKIVAVDYGAKRNILRNLARLEADVTVVPATATAEEILGHAPDGVFLSNGPGDPAATGAYAIPTVQALIDSGKPIFGICLGHQILWLALGGRTSKMQRGHRGANHPVKDLTTGKVEITSQNHGFVVEGDSLPDDLEITHISLFDKSVEGFRHKTKPIFAVQYHPEASPGPTDAHYLFDRFADLIEKHT